MARRIKLAVALLASAVLVLPAAAAARRNLYVAGTFGGTGVAALDVDSAGALAPVTGSPFSTGTNPLGVSLAPDGAHLYVSNLNGASVAAFDVAESGALTPITSSPFPASGQPTGSAVTPDGHRLYVPNCASLASCSMPGSGVHAFQIGGGGALTALPGSPFPTGGAFSRGVAVTPDGRHLYVTISGAPGPEAVSALQIDAAGGLTAVTGTPFMTGGDGPKAVAVTPDGRHLYVANRNSNTISAFDISQGDGALAAVAGSPFSMPGATFPQSMAVTPNGRHLYTANTGGAGTVSGFEIDPTGALTAVQGSPVSAGGGANGVAVTPDGRRLYVAISPAGRNVAGFDIAANGSLAQIVGSPFASGIAGADFQSLAISPDQGPTAAFAATPGGFGHPTSFDGSGSSDPDGSIARLDWDFGDGTTLQDGGPTPTHTYAALGTYTATLTVTDNEGCSTDFVYTGQTASCNGSAAAVTQASVVVADTDAPIIRLSGKRNQKLDSAIEVGVICDEACTATGTGRLIVTVPKSQQGRTEAKGTRSVFRLKRGVARLQPATPATLKLKLPKKARTVARKALKADGRISAKLTLAAADTVGNASQKKRLVKLHD